MIKKLILPLSLAIAILLVILLLVPSAQVSAWQSGDFEIEGSVLKSYNGKDEVIVIPPEITEIGPEAFKESTLTQVTIPGSVRKIDLQAFYGSKNLSRVYISDGVETIGMSAFGNCPKLNMVSIPASVSEIEDGAFCGCLQLSGIDIAKSNKNFFVNDGVLYNYNSSRLIQYLAGRQSSVYEIPFTVRKIATYAFWGAKNLKKVRISNNVREIPAHAFSNCTGLTFVYLPESIRRIGGYGFSDCTNLYYVAIESTACNIADTAFDGCGTGLLTQKGIHEKEAAQVAKKQETSALNGNEKKSENAASDTSDSKDETTDKASERTAEEKHYRTFTPKTIKNEDIDTSQEDLVGVGRVSGGKVLIIP